MTLLKDMEPKELDRALQSLNTAVQAFATEYRDAATSAIDYLFIVNGGSAVALIGAIGSAKAIRDSRAAWLALAAFTIGVLLTGVLRAASFEIARRNLYAYRDLQAKLFAGSISLDQMSQKLLALAPGNWLRRVGYAAFAVFVSGLIVVAFWLVLPMLNTPRLVPAAIPSSIFGGGMVAAAFANVE